MLRRLDGYFHSFLGEQHIKVKLIGINWCAVYVDNIYQGEGPFDLIKKRLTEFEAKHPNIKVSKYLFNDIPLQI